MRLTTGFIHFNDKGEIRGYNSFAYAEYYYNEIQIFEDTFSKKEERKEGEDSHNRHTKGISFNEFCFNEYNKNQNGDEFLEEYSSLFTNKELLKFQEELTTEGFDICMLNIYYLAKYVIEKSKSYIYFKLKPQIKDTLSELSEVKEITFINEDGSKSTSNNKLLIDVILKALEKEKDNKSYEADKNYITWDQISNKEFLQSFFVYDMTMFLKEYFKVERRKNALISKKEQELIIYLMYLLKLTPAILSTSRYRQLLSKYDKINNHLSLVNIKSKEGKKTSKHIGFIKYDGWKNGKIDWTSEDLFSHMNLEENDNVRFM